ncbi:MAG: hypothetical protein GX595_17125 [Lentisphaerae bacterium]|nr:hypothetical protein [Lentisphaerota bacterium]
MNHTAWCTLMALGVAAGSAMAKTGRTYYTDARIATGRANVERYEWAQAVRNRILETGDAIRYYIGPEYTAANRMAALSDEAIWRLMPTTRLPRVYPHERRAICPVHGTEVRKKNVWCPWNIDPIDHPYQIQCMLGGEWYPSNRYDEGDLTSGDFPDDGTGFAGKDGRYYFLSEYINMVYGSVVVPTLRSLSQAYLLTDDMTYARKGCILLARLASEYPNYGWDDPALENRFDRTYLGPFNNQHPHYSWKKGGMVTDLIWETFCLEATAYAYDALYEALADPAVLAFARAKGLPANSADDLRHYIETYILRAGMRGLEAGWIHGNQGFHQAAALAVALVLDDYSEQRPNSRDMVDYAYHGIGQSAFLIVNSTHRDGGGHESAGYNTIKLDFIRVDRLMAQIRARQPEIFPSDRYPALFDNPKARALFDHHIDMLIDDRHIICVGDAGNLNPPTRNTKPRASFLAHENLYAVQQYEDPRHARACVAEDGSLRVGELWEPYPEDLVRRLLDDPSSTIQRPSRLLDGYGLGILESGPPEHRRALGLSYACLRGHTQQDELFLSFFARGIDLLDDLGYPRTWDHRWQFDANSLVHNTVTVDETQSGNRKFGGMGRLFGAHQGVHVVTASHQPYHETPLPSGGTVDLYERTVILVDIDDERFFAVDLFAVGGGEQHDQSWHALTTRVEAPALPWVAQETGTLAGPAVEQFGTWTDRWGRERGDAPAYLTGIRRASLDAPAAWTWPSGLPEGDAVRLTLVPLGGPAEVAMGRGWTPVALEPKLDVVMVRRTVPAGTPSRFLTLLEAYQKTPVIEGVRVVSESPLVLEVRVAGGIEEVTVVVPPGPSRPTAHRPLGVRVRSRRGDDWVRDVRLGAVDEEPGYAQTRIAAVDYPSQSLAVPATPENQAAFVPGRTLRVYNDGRSGLYRITASRRDGERLWLTLDHSALLARERVTGLAADRVVLGALAPVSPATAGRDRANWAAELTVLTFAGGALDKEGRFTGNCLFNGAWLGEGTAARPLRGATPGGTLVLRQPDDVEALKRDFEGRVVSVWEYGPGDAIEIPLWRP